MKPAPFAYHRPRSLAEALDMLADLGEEAKVLAGGQSLVPLMSMRLASPAHLVDLNQVPGLATVDVGAEGVRVGALARHSQVEHDTASYDALPLLRQALRQVAHPTIRNRGTTVGSLVHGDPAAEMPAVLMLLDGSVTLNDVNGTRDVAATAFFKGPMETDLRPGELAVGASFRRPPPGSGSAFVEVSRRHGDYAMCGVGALVTASEGALSAARVCLVGVGTRPVLLDLAPALGDGVVDDEASAALVDAAIDPETDIHATADYRRHLAHVLVRRALAEARTAAEARAA
ncbi:MAG TPA: xanthine dehydrogenase family protein subunit M [Nocardioidaceae bacterium]|nr:xanthine dehydrogenase family protein subunit M [Nocardioidaceae bacterium]